MDIWPVNLPEWGPGSEAVTARATPQSLITESDRVTGSDPRTDPPFRAADGSSLIISQDTPKRSICVLAPTRICR
jgi:hypothetical protein